ncbi:unnamed protein product [Anisakis simplex]|uniref:Uncharacterized protein n=1 Tax=Anisakis simplex TaxID=6269 RepID=A0A3P6PFW9_ANISI|nr:unnamed protein product [Anisakis simplex]
MDIENKAVMDDFILPDELDDIDETNELHYENGMDIDEPNENINTENITAESLSTSANFEKQETIEQYKELIERHKNLKNEEKELDNLARQVISYLR